MDNKDTVLIPQTIPAEAAIYQQSYDETMGKWSKLSVINAVRDPWLPVVYFGIFLLIAGAVYLFWIGREIKDS